MTGRFPIALHIMTLLCTAEDVTSSDYLAGSINVNPVLVRKELSNLKKHNLIISREGKNGGYLLGKPATQVTLAQIFQTIKPASVLGKAKNQPNPACPVGKQINEHLKTLDTEIELAMMKKLGDTNLADFCKRFN
jgi:DNA-binding IscR family transcriptional regulator